MARKKIEFYLRRLSPIEEGPSMLFLGTKCNVPDFHSGLNQKLKEEFPDTKLWSDGFFTYAFVMIERDVVEAYEFFEELHKGREGNLDSFESEASYGRRIIEGEEARFELALMEQDSKHIN